MWLVETGGAISMASAPQLLVALVSGSAASAAASLAGLSLGGTAVTIAADGTVLAPASGAFDVTVAPGHAVQAAVDACPTGGSVLLLPGTHEGPLVLGPRQDLEEDEEGPLILSADKEVHVFGRGRATLRTTNGDNVLVSRWVCLSCFLKT